MDIERIAALLWRFLGVIVIGMAIPGTVMQSAGVFYSAIRSTGDAPGAAAPDSTLVTLTSVVLIVLGVAMIRLSQRLGELIARGL